MLLHWWQKSIVVAAISVSVLCALPARAIDLELLIDSERAAEEIDLTRYALGQGGLSDTPMFDAHADQIARLRPQTVRLFVQEYFDLLPAPDRYHWATLDRSIENILATGARPILSLCFKPRVLFPRVDQDQVHPTDYAAWERLVEALVQHCNRQKGYGIQYWEVGNEVDLGEGGGCPYRFHPADYVKYYARTVAAIRRADPTAKVGGPALASADSSIGDALLEYCGRGEAPLDFFSWHLYADDPQRFRQTIRTVKSKLTRHPRLADTELIVDEWNIGLVKPEPAVGYQAAFILETTRLFLEEGLSRSAYYHIRDFLVDPQDFDWMSTAGKTFMTDWWNVKPQNSGLFDNRGRRRPAYYSFLMLSHLNGKRIPISGNSHGIQALAVQRDGEIHVVLWNFAPLGAGQPCEVALRFRKPLAGSFQARRLNSAANRLDVVRSGPASELETRPLRLELEPYAVAWIQAGTFTGHASWGHRATSSQPYYLQLVPTSPALEVLETRASQLESDDVGRGGTWQGSAGGGDVDGIEFELALPSNQGGDVRQEQTIWTHLLAESDPDTQRRIRQDPAFQTEPALLTFRLDPAGTRGFSVSVDQLLEHGTLWVPEFDMFLRAGASSITFDAHQLSLAQLAGRRTLDRARNDREATYADFTAKWADMGSPDYRNPHAVAPGHVVGITWDSAIPKFGVDRQAGVISDLGTLDRFKCDVDFAQATWKGQRLTGGLPLIVTTYEQEGVRWEVEQFAFPLQGPPDQRRGDIDMVLLQKVSATQQSGPEREVTIRVRHEREVATADDTRAVLTQRPGTSLLTESALGQCLLAVEGTDLSVKLTSSASQLDEKRKKTNLKAELTVKLSLPAQGTREFIVKLPSPGVVPAERDALLSLDYATARSTTLKFWSDYLQRGAVFHVPDGAVNELFRANLWHALRLPRRHGGPEMGVDMDLPYSNFAYGQLGTPWPVNQAVYVDYMLYDLRGYHDISREELLAIYRNNQEDNGRVGGYANWGVYTPSMVYVSAKHYLLSRDRASFEQLLPATLRAADWCLEQLRQTAPEGSSVPGLVLAPLNDLSHEPRAWAFNQAYVFAGLDSLADVLDEIEHPRAAEMRTAADTLASDVARAFGRASAEAPIVLMRDHTWSRYVPSDALTARRLLEIWYPTDVDTGPLHLSRLKALDPQSDLTSAMLHDHEDNLYLKAWGMANEPVYNQQAMTYLLRDEPELAIRAFYSMMACAFSHRAFEPVEHRWGWGQYFGPPSTDGAWFELYRYMLIHERDDGSLLLGQAVPRAWLKDGQQVSVQRAPSRFGPLNVALNGLAAGRIQATVELAGSPFPPVLLVRLRHPTAARLKSVEVNGQTWTDFDPAREWVRITPVTDTHYEIVASFTDDFPD